MFSHFGVPSAAADVVAKFHQLILFSLPSHVSSVCCAHLISVFGWSCFLLFFFLTMGDGVLEV